MKSKITEHILSIIVVSLLLFIPLYFVYRSSAQLDENSYNSVNDFIGIPFINYNDQLHRAILIDMIVLSYPHLQMNKNSLLQKIDAARTKNKNIDRDKMFSKQRLSREKIFSIIQMAFKFFFTFIVVLVLTTYGVQTIGVWLFIRKKQTGFQRYKTNNNDSSFKIPTIVSGIITTVLYCVLFSPGYVIAYSFKTKMDTNNSFFLIVLALISNGVLITYAYKFYTLLIAESRKGYVETAITKGLSYSYSIAPNSHLSFKNIIAIRKSFKGHVLEHIYKNVLFQYVSTIKEQASFIITGIIIIEMALNIHGHLTYELLRNILYKNFDIALAIILCIFYSVKTSEIITDCIEYRLNKRYDNHT